MALARDALRAGIADGSALEADQRHKAAQEQVDLAEVCKFLQYTRADEPVVRVVIHDLRAHRGEEFIKALRGEALEEGVRLAAGAHTVHDLTAVEIRVDHRVHGVDVVLSVAVDGNRDVAVLARLHESGKDRVLVAAVAALADADIVLVPFGKLRNDLPRPVAAAVVDEHDPTLGTYFTHSGKLVYLCKEHRRRYRQHRLLIVARHDYIQYGSHDSLLKM